MICVIPARGGSKRLPGKNIKELNGKPVIAYPIAAALESGLFETVIVSTDDVVIGSVAQREGAIEWRRPEELCADDVPDVEVIQYHIDEHNLDVPWEENYLCYLYPTAALTTPEQLIRGLDACRALGGKIECRVRYLQKPIRTFTEDAGQFYWIKAGDPIEVRGYIELDPMECQDVNTDVDWFMLERKFALRK